MSAWWMALPKSAAREISRLLYLLARWSNSTSVGRAPVVFKFLWWCGGVSYRAGKRLSDWCDAHE